MNDSSPQSQSSSSSVTDISPMDTRTGSGDSSGATAVLRSFLLIVGIPTLAAVIYYGLIASDIYISEAKYAIRTSDTSKSAGLMSEILGSSETSRAGDDAAIVRDYILSRDMLEDLDTRLNLRSHYISNEVDWLTRLERDASEEDFLKYYRDMLSVDAGPDITSLRVKAFDPAMAQQIATAIIELSEQLVNQLSERIINDTLRFARSELALAESRVRKSSTAVSDFRKQTQLIDPTLESSSVLSIVTGLETQLAEARTELLEAESYMQPHSPRVKGLRTRVAALTRQVENERQRLANEGDNDLTKLLYGYEPLILEQKLSEQLYASALNSLELARTEAQRKQRYLIPFVSPELPDEALEPERIWNILTVCFAACLVYGIGGLVWSALNDHF